MSDQYVRNYNHWSLFSYNDQHSGSKKEKTKTEVKEKTKSPQIAVLDAQC